MFRFENKPSSRIMLEKVLSLYVRKKNSITRGLGKKSYPNKITHTPMVNHIGGGGRGGLDRALGLF